MDTRGSWALAWVVWMAAPATALAQQPAPVRGPSDPFEQALDCFRRDDAQCAVRALTGRARTSCELRLLIAAYRQLRDATSSAREMQAFVRLYPRDHASVGYRAYLAAHAIAAVDPPVPIPRGTSPMAVARECVNRGDQRCVIRVLRGRTGSAELRLLISTYRAMSDSGSAVREMRRYIARYPADSYANMYRQFLYAHRR